MYRVSMGIVWAPLLITLAAAFGSAGDAAAQGGVYAYPLNGQSQERQQRDQFECHQWAVRQTGFDPITATPVTSSQHDAEDGSGSSDSSTGFLGIGGDRNAVGGQGNVVSDAATGAALGAIGGAIAGDAGAGALIGAGASAVLGGIARSGSRGHQPRSRREQPPHQTRLGNYRRAYSACMSGHGYQVQG